MFCFYFAESGNAERAAAKAGYLNPAKTAAALAVRKDINEEMEELYRQREKNIRHKSICGYERIAFGDVSDAVRLMFENEYPEEKCAEYDLFNVAEIKRPKEGAMEIKFFDRLKALEKLENLKNADKSAQSDIYNAVIGGIAQYGECDKVDEEE